MNEFSFNFLKKSRIEEKFQNFQKEIWDFSTFFLKKKWTGLRIIWKTSVFRSIFLFSIFFQEQKTFLESPKKNFFNSWLPQGKKRLLLNDWWSIFFFFWYFWHISKCRFQCLLSFQIFLRFNYWIKKFHPHLMTFEYSKSFQSQMTGLSESWSKRCQRVEFKNTEKLKIRTRTSPYEFC